MKISRVEIHNFRNFKNFSAIFTEEFQTIIGENNIGKSNFLWALRLVLDKNLSVNSRNLREEDFNDFPEINRQSYIAISVIIRSQNFESLPNLYSLRISESECRVTYLFAHKNKFDDLTEEPAVVFSDFGWKLLGGWHRF